MQIKIFAKNINHKTILFMKHTEMNILRFYVRYRGIGEIKNMALARKVKFSCILLDNFFTALDTQAFFSIFIQVF